MNGLKKLKSIAWRNEEERSRWGSLQIVWDKMAGLFEHYISGHFDNKSITEG